VVKDFPLESIHKMASKLAEAAECAGEQGKFWETRDRFFTNQKDLKLENLQSDAEALGLNKENFQKCLDSAKYAEKIKGDIGEGQKATVRSIPTILIGFAEPGDKVRAVKMLKGAQPYTAFKETIDNLLNPPKQ